MANRIPFSTKPPPGTLINFDHPSVVGLSHFYPMWEGSGTVINDIVGIESGTLANALGAGVMWWQGFSKGVALTHDAGNGDGVGLFNGFTLTKNWSFDAYIYPTALSGYNNIFSQASSLGLWLNNGKLDLYLGADHNGTNAVSANAWSHIAVTVDASGNTNYYINGVLDATIATLSPNFTVSSFLADSSSTGGESFHGNVLYYRFWRRVITPQEVNNFYVNPWGIFLMPRRRELAQLAAIPALTSVGVQQVSITIANGATTGTATITTVGTGAFIVWQGCTTTDTGTTVSSDARVELTNTTTVTATRNTTSTDTITVNAVVVDGNTTNLIKSVQSGTTTIGTAATSATSSITAVTNANTAIFYLGSSSASAASFSREDCNVSLSGTTVTATRGVSSGATIAGWCVVEFQSAALNSATQNVSVTTTASGTSFSTAITGVNPVNTMLAFGGFLTLLGSTPNKSSPRMSLASSTSVHTDYNTAPAVTTEIANCVVIEFASALLAQDIQRGTIAISAGTSNTATITSSTTTQTLCNWLNNTTTTSTFAPNTSLFRITQTNATTLTESVNSSATGTGSYEVITFNPAAAAGSNTFTETVTETDSETILVTGNASFTETETETDSSIAHATSTPLLLTETQTETDSYTSQILLTNTLTETANVSDSFNITAIQSIANAENATATDSISGAATGLTNLNETGTTSDTHQGITLGLGILTEIDTETDSYNSSQTQLGQNNFTETVTDTDSVNATAIDADGVIETVAANDNYSSQLIPAGGIVVTPVTGSGDDPWHRYIKWLDKKKHKQFKQRAIQEGISKPEAIKIAEIATAEVKKQEIELKVPYYASIGQNEQLARHAAQISVNQIYEAVWEEYVREAAKQQRERDEEDEFFMMMM